MQDRDHTKDMTRRALLRTGAAAAAAVAIASLARGGSTTAPAGQPGPATQPVPPLPVRPLGKTGVKVSVLNQGTYGLSRRLLDYTYAQGVRYFDTADCYRNGQSEAEIGIQAIDISERRVLSALASGQNPGAASSMLKAQGAEAVQRVDELALDAIGVYGAVSQPEAREAGSNIAPVGPAHGLTAMARYLNDRASTIYGGSNEIQRDIIAKAVLGL